MGFTASGFSRALVFASALVVAPQVFAHAHLKAQTPAANAEIATAPSAITLNFSEGIEPKFSGLTVTDSQKQAVKTGPATRSDSDKTQMVVPLEQPLASGDYTVDWHVVSVDGHKTRGSYRFTLK